MIGVLTLHHAVHLLQPVDMLQMLLIGLASYEVFEPPNCICPTNQLLCCGSFQR